MVTCFLGLACVEECVVGKSVDRNGPIANGAQPPQQPRGPWSHHRRSDRHSRRQAQRWCSKDTVGVVTGSNKGLGQATAQKLARNGLTVVSTTRDSARGLAVVESAVHEEPQLKEFLHFHQLDVTANQSVADLASYLHSTFGVDILINNAAMSKFQSELYEDAVETIETNYFGTKRVTVKLLPLLRASPFGARIVMVSSQVGQMEVKRLLSVETEEMYNTRLEAEAKKKALRPPHVIRHSAPSK